MIKLKKIIPLIIILTLLLVYYFLDLGRLITFENLKENHRMLRELVACHPMIAPLLTVLLYALIVSLSLPIAGITTIFVGYLFPIPLSTALVVTGATIGATVIFLCARSAFSALLYERVQPYLARIEPKIRNHGAGYLLTMRLFPLIPFWLLNLAPAFLGVPLKTFIWTTFVGIIPGSFVFTSAGAGLASVFEQSDHFSINAIFTKQVIIAMFLLSLFALIPTLYKSLRDKK